MSEAEIVEPNHEVFKHFPNMQLNILSGVMLFEWTDITSAKELATLLLVAKRRYDAFIDDYIVKLAVDEDSYLLGLLIKADIEGEEKTGIRQTFTLAKDKKYILGYTLESKMWSIIHVTDWGLKATYNGER